MSGFDYVVIGLMALVVVVLVSGLVVMAIGGKTDRKFSNKLMVIRVGVQALVVFLLGAMFLLSR